MTTLKSKEQRSLENRFDGGIKLVISGLLGYAGIKYNLPICDIASVYIGISGAGDLITGYNSYLDKKAFEGVKYLLSKHKK